MAEDLDPQPEPESLVVADLGKGESRAYLLEQIGGAFRFVAKAEGPTTAEPPIADLTVGWDGLLRQLEADSGRRLRERGGLLMPQLERGDGVDGLLVCSSLGEPIRVAVLESGPSPVAAPVIEAIKRGHSRLFHIPAPSGRKDGGWAAAQGEALRSFKPELVVLIAGNDQGGAFARLVGLLRQLTMGQVVASALVIADGAEYEQALSIFGAKTKARGVSPSAKTPGEVAAEVEKELFEGYRARLGSADFDDLTAEAAGRIMVRAQAVDLVNRFIARAFNRRVLTIAIDDGAHVHWANRDQGALATLPQVDLSAAIAGLTTRELTDALTWLPFEATEDELVTWVLNRAVRPWTRPINARDALIEQAITRQVARRGLAEIARTHPLALTGSDLVIGGPWFARWNQPGAAALALLDCVDVVPDHGVLDLALDQDGLMAAAGTVASLHPELASDVFDYDCLIHLGSAVVIGGTLHEGEPACRGEIHYETGEMGTFTVRSGSIEVLPLHPGETATLVLRPERRFSIGGRPAGESVTLADDRRIIGGTVGVIIDARGRSLHSDTKNRQAKVKRWLDTANGVIAPTVRRSA